jgi:hypothetical protein
MCSKKDGEIAFNEQGTPLQADKENLRKQEEYNKLAREQFVIARNPGLSMERQLLPMTSSALPGGPKFASQILNKCLCRR